MGRINRLPFSASVVGGGAGGGIDIGDTGLVPTSCPVDPWPSVPPAEGDWPNNGLLQEYVMLNGTTSFYADNAPVMMTQKYISGYFFSTVTVSGTTVTSDGGGDDFQNMFPPIVPGVTMFTLESRGQLGYAVIVSIDSANQMTIDQNFWGNYSGINGYYGDSFTYDDIRSNNTVLTASDGQSCTWYEGPVPLTQYRTNGGEWSDYGYMSLSLQPNAWNLSGSGPFPITQSLKYLGTTPVGYYYPGETSGLPPGIFGVYGGVEKIVCIIQAG